MQASIVSRLGQISTAQFMREYWQRKPLLIRAAFGAAFVPPVSAQQVLAQVNSDAAPSRLIEQLAGNNSASAIEPNWQLTHGPFAKLPSLKRPGWTVLLQGANTVWPELAQLMNRFRFVPDARLDDLMISVASDRGGVGPHLDSYDVFLLQASGQRHWRWGKVRDKSLQDDQPIKLLKHFVGGKTALLDPGDMLYLPAGWAHDGVAQGNCMTYSIGFRASTQREIVGEFLARASDLLDKEGRQVRDLRHTPSKTPAQIPPAIAQDYETLIRSFVPSSVQIAQFTGQHLSEPAAHVFFDAPASPLNQQKFVAQSQKRGLQMHHATRALYDKAALYMNGDSFVGASRLLKQFFNQRDISPNQLADTTDNDINLLYDWYCSGWIFLK